MQEEIDLCLEVADEAMESAIAHFQRELSKVRTGKASPAMVSGVLVDYYGSPTLLSQVANVSVSDSRTLTIQPWEGSMIGPIEKAIFGANLGLTPQNDGKLIRISIPMLTEERRKELVKQVKSLGEDARVTIRGARRDAMESIKKLVKDGYSEDLGKRTEETIDSKTKNFSAKVEQLTEAKEKDIMTI